MNLAILSLECASNEFSFAAPDHAVSITPANDILLVVDGAEDGVAAQPNQQNSGSNNR